MWLFSSKLYFYQSMQTRNTLKKQTTSKPHQSKQKSHSKSKSNPKSRSKSKPKLQFQPAPNTIYFYGTKSQNGFMSNFYPSQIQVDYQHFPTVEHYFQSRKFVGTPIQLEIIKAKTPGQAFTLARKYKIKRTEDWNKIKVEVMKNGLIAKFSQHQNLKKLLVQTGQNDLVQHTFKDKFWADGGGPGKGENMLGKLLVEVRKEIVKK